MVISILTLTAGIFSAGGLLSLALFELVKKLKNK